ncbi:MerC domain-containing protein [Sphingomonas lacusdianchii]|uniref:MerC domain-containing protein n=1 Tax=Sphingomonas lacusdianchii TaxID=2917992 RepID=UPI001F5841A9|nr:MerC domain-containing protein [Sphingomonas sp. JXJ CY 53]
MQRTTLLDGAAIGASLLCLIHCIGLPILFALLPALASIGLPSSEWLHLLLLLTAIPVSALALVGGWRAHGRVVPMLLGALGLAGLAAGLAFDSVPGAETALTVAGSLALAMAHIGNWRRLQTA